MAATCPQIGDLVIRYPHRAVTVFIVSVCGASQRITSATYSEALTLARRVAKPMHADVWYTHDGDNFTFVQSYRQPV
jgi:hypothetical protein